MVVGTKRVAKRIFWQTIFRARTDKVKRATVSGRCTAWFQCQPAFHFSHQFIRSIAGRGADHEAVIAEDQDVSRSLRETLAHGLRERQAGMMIIEPAPGQAAQSGGQFVPGIRPDRPRDGVDRMDMKNDWMRHQRVQRGLDRGTKLAFGMPGRQRHARVARS